MTDTLIPPPMGQPYRRTGRVKFFNVNKGYGFIVPTTSSSNYRDGSSGSSKGSTYEDDPSEEEGKQETITPYIYFFMLTLFLFLSICSSYFNLRFK